MATEYDSTKSMALNLADITAQCKVLARNIDALIVGTEEIDVNINKQTLLTMSKFAWMTCYYAATAEAEAWKNNPSAEWLAELATGVAEDAFNLSLDKAHAYYNK